MSLATRSIARLGSAALLAALTSSFASSAEAATQCDPASLQCAVGTAALSAKITTPLPTQIDSGWMDKGKIKIRTRFTIDPVKGDPLVAIDMPKGAVVEASWNEKGYVNVRPTTGAGAEGTMNVHYTLAPSIEASIYGINIAYNASQLINKVPGAKFNYDVKGSGKFAPWGFAGAEVKTPMPSLDSSTIFSLPFSQLGVSTGTVEGKLSIQAAASPTFKFTTKDVRFDSSSVTAADGIAKVPVGDNDFLDLVASVNGELGFTGTLQVRPVVQVDSVAGIPTFGLVKFSFSAVEKPIGGAPMPVNFDATTIHIPLPNVKVPATPVNFGSVKAGGQAEKSITIENTGELGGKMTVTSSDPQFVVPSGELRVGPKGKLDLKIAFKGANEGPASATITVKSNDPDSPEQTFKIAANGGSLESDDEDGSGGRSGGKDSLEPLSEDSGCSAAPSGLSQSSRAPAFAALGLGLGLAAFARRRRR